jgi:5-methylcytosine-specific restriction protein A
MDEWISIEKDNAHIAREKKKAAQLKKTQWWKNRIAQGKCNYCGNIFLPSDLTMDHLVPLARGGKSTKSNVVPCCKDCNNKKKYLTPLDMKLKELNRNK